MWNVAVGGTCVCFIGSVYSYSMYKMKQGGEEVADEIALHEANMAAAKAAAAAEVRIASCQPSFYAVAIVLFLKCCVVLITRARTRWLMPVG